MENNEIAKILNQIAAVYITQNENRFKIIAYQNAAESIKKSPYDIKELWKENKLDTIAGIGKTIAAHLEEMFTTGRVKHFDTVLNKVPKSFFVLLQVPTIGPKKAYKLISYLKITNPATVIDELLDAARTNKIASIPTFGPKSQQEIVSVLERFKEGQKREKRIPLSRAWSIALDAIEYLKKKKDACQIEPLGSLRRMVSTIGDIDLAVSTDNPKEIIQYFTNYPKARQIIDKGSTGATILLDDHVQVDLRVQTPDKFGAMLQYFTGSKEHNIHLRELALKNGLSLSEYGIKIIKRIKNSELGIKNYNKKTNIYEFEKETDFYHAIGLPWIPPELREDTGEIEAALRQAQGKPSGLPDLVKSSDIKGDLHIHSDFNIEPSHDLGISSLEEILTEADKFGYEYIGISDHNPSKSKHTNEQINNILKRRKAYFEHILSSNKNIRVKLLTMLEVDILPDGTLPLNKQSYNYLDAIIVSVHSSFLLAKDKMTERIIKGLSHPKAKILGHPTGRLIGKRDGYELDWSKLFQFCRNNHKAIEINSFPDRLDLPDNMVREAIRQNVPLVINTDSHDKRQMDHIKYGISVAKRGWAAKGDILNTLPYNKMLNWLKSV